MTVSKSVNGDGETVYSVSTEFGVEEFAVYTRSRRDGTTMVDIANTATDGYEDVIGVPREVLLAIAHDLEAERWGGS